MRGDNAFPIDNEGLRKMTNGVTPTPALQPQLSAEVFATFVGMIDQTTLQRIFAGLAVRPHYHLLDSEELKRIYGVCARPRTRCAADHGGRASGRHNEPHHSDDRRRQHDERRILVRALVAIGAVGRGREPG